VLAHAIVREGAKAVAAGMNPMDLKRGVDLAVGAVVAALQKNSKIADKSTAPYSSFPSGEQPPTAVAMIDPRAEVLYRLQPCLQTSC
jgi:hypothetical protein